MNYTLGLDMGVASIGWAVVSNNGEKAFIDSGVRIFPAGLDAFDSGKENNPNDSRRTKRGMRRRIRRKAERKLLLRQNLTELGWIPSSQHERDNNEIRAWEQLDPYDLRHRAISEQVSLAELGRIILHLNQRRGFLSLRKSQDASDKDSQGMLGEMTELENKIQESGHKTLGNYLYHLRDQDLRKNNNIPLEKLRCRHLRRKLTYQEFDLIWTTQQAYYPDILTDDLRYGMIGKRENPIAVVTPKKRDGDISIMEQFGLENLLFFQRRVWWPDSSIGLCELEQPILFAQLKEKGLLDPTKKYERRALEKQIQRAPVADRRFQEFRLLCEINNLRLTNDEIDSTLERKLTAEEREIALHYCYTTKTPKVAGLKTKLSKYLKVDTQDNLHLNLEAGGRTKLNTILTDHVLSDKKKALGNKWNLLTDDQKNKVVEILTDPSKIDDDLIVDFEQLDYLTPDDIQILVNIDLGAQRANLCVPALEKLLPHLRQNCRYMSSKEEGDSALHLAGYLRRDEQAIESLDILPRFDDPQYSFAQTITSPVVRRAMTELRKVVNSLIRKYGKPTRIHVEMARDLKMSPKQRREHNKKNNQIEKERDTAKKAIEAEGYISNRAAVQRYLLWKEQKEMCAYTQTVIPLNMLFEGEVDIDHIIPYSKCADDSYLNKVVCLRNANAQKSNETPFSWLAHSDPIAYKRILDFAKLHLSKQKYKKFTLREIPADFSNRDLNDTAWMAKAARSYLAQLYPAKEQYKVQGTKGKHTATLRDVWKLNGLLNHAGEELKNRDDHRHHALDAIVIALTTKERIDAIVKSKKYEQSTIEAQEAGKRLYRLKPTIKESSPLKAPWDSFRASVQESLNNIWISHRANKKVSGALHKETYYGKTQDGSLVVRKAVKDLSNKDLPNIRDERIYEIIQLHLSDGGTLDDEIKMPSGVPIKKVRVLVNNAHLTLRDGTPNEIHVWSDKTHHVSIFALGDGKCHFQPVNLLEATTRLRDPARNGVYDTNPPREHPEAEFMFHLSIGETVLCEIDGVRRLFVYKTVSSTGGKQIFFAEHLDANPMGKDHPQAKKHDRRRSATPGTFLKNFPNAEKVIVMPNGELRRSQ